MNAYRWACWWMHGRITACGDWCRYYAWQIILLAIVIVFIACVGLMAWAVVFAPESSVAAIEREWIREQTRLEADPEWQAEQERLHRRHGTGHVIIYTEQGTYYVNARGDKCRFM